MPGTVVVIPCFNEADRLDKNQVRELAAAENTSVLLVDDGSTDTTAALLEELSAADPQRISHMLLPENRGKAEAVRIGLGSASARAEIVGYLDADFATPAREMIRLIQCMGESNADVLMGARVARLGAHIERRRIRHYLGRVFATGASIALGCEVYDTQCGAKLFRVSDQFEQAIAREFSSRWAFDVELLDRLIRGGASIREEPLEEWCDVAGSKLKTTDMISAALDLVSIARRGRKRS